MTEERVSAMADQLRQYATHFAPRDWCYTREVGDLRMVHGSPMPHVKRGLEYLLRGVADIFPEEPSMRPSRWAMCKAALRAWETNPDGVLDGGNIITNWEETGEYLQYVQPSVGALLADLMDAHPDLPEVQAIADEMKRINDDYGQRIEASA